jgi:hypothetical protein
MTLYDKTLVVVDQMGNQLTRDRIREFCLLTGREVHLCYIATEIQAPEGWGRQEAEVTDGDVGTLQEYVDILASEGLAAHGRIISSPEQSRGDAIAGLAESLGVDLLILNFEIGGARAKSRIAQQVLSRNVRMAVLVARPTT